MWSDAPINVPTPVHARVYMQKKTASPPLLLLSLFLVFFYVFLFLHYVQHPQFELLLATTATGVFLLSYTILYQNKSYITGTWF